MAYVQIDIDMSELDTDDLVEEICERVKYIKGENMKKLKEHFMPLLEEINMTRDGSIEIKSLEDKIKY